MPHVSGRGVTTTLPEDLTLVFNTCTWWLTATCKLQLQGFCALDLQISSGTRTHAGIPLHRHRLKNKIDVLNCSASLLSLSSA